MASADVREELNCSICLSIYTDPVTLSCGHNYCRVCIDRVLDTQEPSGRYSCPDCRIGFLDRPSLHRNITLHNIAECFLSIQPAREESGVSCTYCDSSQPALKTCLLCEASLCAKHLRKHSKSSEHILMDPSSPLESRKCSVHKKILEYYCTEDSACICVTCCLAGEHRGHQVEPMDDASEKKKVKLRPLLQALSTTRAETEKKVQILHRHQQKIRRKSSGETERVAALFRDLRRQLDDLEKKVLTEICRQEEQISLSISALTQHLEMKMDELSGKIHYIEELCDINDPLSLLQEKESEADVFFDPEDQSNDTKLCDVGDLDKNLISLTLHSGVSIIESSVQNGIHIVEVADLLLDAKTVSNFINLAEGLKTASYSKSQKHPDSAERFEDCQVLSIKNFSSGKHYWEVETSKLGNWMMGVAYGSIDRKGEKSFIGNNTKSWCLCKANKKFSVMHNSKTSQLPDKASSQRFVVCLDYEAGRLSFYELGDSVKHLHTFNTSFTEPLHAAFYLWDEWLRIRS
ncbi:E3 ubiquitin/ISG15 ligase TRIM25-like [Hyperolius riggenbachi]|uniref:E3 ubiquitin/ISG15 ligase TRIM25-like n=1 Tax=Hyperolius riggenbachi TaxID=752182 RepID=UPI0035A2FE0E